MAWPFTPLVTFVANNPPTVDADFLNALQAAVNALQYSKAGQFGDGSDGDATLDGAIAAPSWATKSGSVYTATRDVWARAVILDNATIDMAGYRFYASASLTMQGAAPLVRCNGAAATGRLGAAGAPKQSLFGGSAGGNGGVNSGAAPTAGTGSSPFPKFSGTGGNGGAGAVGDPGGGAAGGTAVAVISNAGGWKHLDTLHQGYVIGQAGGVATLLGLTGGAGGGGGGADDAGLTDGGGGGGGGGVMVVAARQLILGANATIQAKGGAGGPGGGNHAGGGGGGGGGDLWLTYAQLILNGHTLTRDVAGGAGGVGLVNGSPGIAGALIEHDLGA